LKISTSIAYCARLFDTISSTACPTVISNRKSSSGSCCFFGRNFQNSYLGDANAVGAGQCAVAPFGIWPCICEVKYSEIKWSRVEEYHIT